MTNEKRKILNGTLRYVFLIIMALFVLVPVLWMVSTAFKTEQYASEAAEWIMTNHQDWIQDLEKNEKNTSVIL